MIVSCDIHSCPPLYSPFLSDSVRNEERYSTFSNSYSTLYLPSTWGPYPFSRLMVLEHVMRMRAIYRSVFISPPQHRLDSIFFLCIIQHFSERLGFRLLASFSHVSCSLF